MSTNDDESPRGVDEPRRGSGPSADGSIAESLRGSAAGYANRALIAYVTGGRKDFALFAGIAIEHAAKARLASENSAFLAPDRSFHASVALNRASADVRLLPTGTRTVGASIAIERCGQLDPGVKAVLDAAKPLVAMRNGEAHMGLAEAHQAVDEFVRFVRAVEALMPTQLPALWAPNEAVVAAALSELAEETDRIVAAKLAAGGIRFQQLSAGADPGALDAILAVLQTRRDARTNAEEVLEIECPACGQAASVLGYTEETDMEVDYDRDGNPESAWPVLTFFAGGVECEVCGLELDGSDELASAKVELSWHNDQIDLNDWMRANYADEDSY